MPRNGVELSVHFQHFYKDQNNADTQLYTEWFSFKVYAKNWSSSRMPLLIKAKFSFLAKTPGS